MFFSALQDLLLVFAGKEALDRGFVKPEEVLKIEIFEGTYKNRDPFCSGFLIIPILLMLQKFCTRNNTQHV